MLNFNWFKRLFKSYDIAEDTQHVPYTPMEYPSIYGTKIWAVGGGKGGVGKTLLATNLGILLSKNQKRVLLIDADLGAANLHTFLGVDGGRTALSSFLKEEVPDLQSLAVKTPIPNLDLISGAKDSLDVADIKPDKVARLKDALRKVDYDYAILDIGPGTSSTLLDMFLISNEGIILSTPEPTTIENNYRFLKCLFLRKIKTLADAQDDGKLKDLLQKVFSEKWSQRVKTVSDILNQLSTLDPEQGRVLREHVSNTNISMVMNQMKKNEDKEIGSSIKRACSDYFGIDIGYLGSVSYEECVSDSIRNRKPLTIHYSSSGAARGIESCLNNLLNKNKGSNGFSTINQF
ncbi:MAG: AAA family ATPase [Deltaproteobacteria bacterium]|nr:AAA family ATPase [Deltaproteobacteria bacterium]